MLPEIISKFNARKLKPRSYLHSRRRYLNSIPLCSMVVLLVGMYSLTPSSYCFAALSTPGVIVDAGTISLPTGGSPAPAPTASLSLSKTELKSDATMPGHTATISTNVTVAVGNASSYNLTLRIQDSADIKVESGSTILKAGNLTTDNTWGYKWDNSDNYTAPSTTAQALAIPTLSNNTASFTKTLTFAAKFATDAEAGHYKASGTLSLVATPKTATYTMADLTEMQQLAEGYAPDACANTIIPTGKDYAGPYTLKDVRDNNTYTVYKFRDGKCWMTENLKLTNANVGTATFTDGRLLIPSTSDVSTNWTLPASSTSGFDNVNSENTYYDNSRNTGYYTWCAATANTCGEATSQGINAPSSICPKGWKLPTGGPDGDFAIFAEAEGIANSAAGVDKIQNPPYNFTHTGYTNNSSTANLGVNGRWWSRTSLNNTLAYTLRTGDNTVHPGADNSRHYGFAMRCIAE